MGMAPPMPAPHDQSGAPMAGVPVGSSYTLGAGMRAPVQQAASRMDRGSVASNNQSATGAYASGNMANSQGVISGQSAAALPSVVGPAPTANFDPNDPRNAALAGYMAQ